MWGGAPGNAQHPDTQVVQTALRPYVTVFVIFTVYYWAIFF